MGPVRGTKKKKKKIIEKRHEENAYSGSSEKDGPRDWSDELFRRINGVQSPSKVVDKFESVFKISRKTFDYICSLVNEDMLAKAAHFSFTSGKPMSLHDQVAVALRRLSSGDSLVTIGELFGLNHSTVSQVTWRFIESMEVRGLHHLHWPSTETEMSEIKAKFESVRGFPNCCGVVDTTHIVMCLPAADPTGDVWLDSEQNHSMVLQVIVDPDMRFRDVVTGWPGKMKDWSVFESSTLHKLCVKGEILNGKKVDICKGSEIREYLIGDLGYPLLPHLVIPYDGKDLSEMKYEFNKVHSATRMIAHRALSRLKDTWRIIQGLMWRPDKHRLPRIILVCCLLHNIVIDMEDELAKDSMAPFDNHDLGYRQEICGTAEMAGVTLRDKLALYLSARLTN